MALWRSFDGPLQKRQFARLQTLYNVSREFCCIEYTTQSLDIDRVSYCMRWQVRGVSHPHGHGVVVGSCMDDAQADRASGLQPIGRVFRLSSRSVCCLLRSSPAWSGPPTDLPFSHAVPPYSRACVRGYSVIHSLPVGRTVPLPHPNT